MGHVNNAMYRTYLEVACDRSFTDVVGKRLNVLSTVFVHMGIDFR